MSVDQRGIPTHKRPLLDCAHKPLSEASGIHNDFSYKSGVIFLPQPFIVKGRENHHQCCVFCQTLPNLHLSLSTPFSMWIFRHRGPVGRAFAWQTGGRGSEPGLALQIFVAEIIPVLNTV